MSRRRILVVVVGCLAIALAGALAPSLMDGVAAFVLGPVFERGGGLIIAAATIYLLLSLALALGPYGRVKLGDAPPEFSTASWLAMLFCTGMGLGLVFFGAAEPLLHFAHPPTGRGFTADAARRAIALAGMNWGVHAWGVFALGGLTVGYFVHRRGASYLPSAPFTSVFPRAARVAGLVDVLAIVAVVFGVAGSLAMAVMQLETGLQRVFGIPSNGWTAAACIALMVASYVASAASGIDAGIKWLSNVNIVLALGLLVTVLALGPTAELFGRMVTAVADNPGLTARLSLRMEPFAEISAWMKPWTLTYLIWFVAWAPFVAVFMARISRGRTIRAFVLGVLVMPTLACTLWFAVFGGTALAEEIRAPGLVAATEADITGAAFALDQRLPWSTGLDVASVIMLVLFSVTGFDSATFVLGMLTSRGSLDPPVPLRVAWGIGVGLLGGVLLLADRMEVLRAVAIAGALPFTVVLLVQGVLLVRTLRGEHAASTTTHGAPT